jgi:hypothetical protein
MKTLFLQERQRAGKRKHSPVLKCLTKDKHIGLTENLPILGSVNYITDMQELAPVFSLNSSKCGLFYKEKATCVESELQQNKKCLVSLK